MEIITKEQLSKIAIEARERQEKILNEIEDKTIQNRYSLFFGNLLLRAESGYNYVIIERKNMRLELLKYLYSRKFKIYFNSIEDKFFQLAKNYTDLSDIIFSPTTLQIKIEW